MSAAEVARRVGVSERSIQRRCKTGKMSARLVPTPTGQQWLVDASALDFGTLQSGDAKREAGGDTTPTRRGDRAATQRRQTTGTTPDSDDIAARYVGRLEEENRFLRGLVEQHQRAEAELRAALRRALDIAPRQLQSGQDSTAPQNVTEAARDSVTPQTTTTAPRAPQKPARRAPRALWQIILGVRPKE